MHHYAVLRSVAQVASLGMRTCDLDLLYADVSWESQVVGGEGRGGGGGGVGHR